MREQVVSTGNPKEVKVNTEIPHCCIQNRTIRRIPIPQGNQANRCEDIPIPISNRFEELAGLEEDIPPKQVNTVIKTKSTQKVTKSKNTNTVISSKDAQTVKSHKLNNVMSKDAQTVKSYKVNNVMSKDTHTVNNKK